MYRVVGTRHRWRLGLDAEDDGELELWGGANQFDFGRPGAAEGFLPEHLDLPAGRQVAQMAWVEVEREK